MKITEHGQLLIAQGQNEEVTATDDNRYAFMNGFLFDVTRWEILEENGQHVDRHILSVYDASANDCSFNSTYGGYDMPAEEFIVAYVYDTKEEAEENLFKLMKQALSNELREELGIE